MEAKDEVCVGEAEGGVLRYGETGEGETVGGEMRVVQGVCGAEKVGVAVEGQDGNGEVGCESGGEVAVAGADVDEARNGGVGEREEGGNEMREGRDLKALCRARAGLGATGGEANRRGG